MKITSMAARLRILAAELEVLASVENDMDLPDEVVVPFLAQVVADPLMIGGLLSRSMKNVIVLPTRTKAAAPVR